MEYEVCSVCGCSMGRRVQAYVHNNRVVCQHCHNCLTGIEEFRKTASYHVEAVLSLVLGIIGLSFPFVFLIMLKNVRPLGDESLLVKALIVSTGILALLIPFIIISALSLGLIAKRGIRGGPNYRSGRIVPAAIIISGISFGAWLTIVIPASPPLLLLAYPMIWFWVFVDSYDLMKDISKAERREIGGLIKSPSGWFAGCAALLIVVLPYYLGKRIDYIKFQRRVAADRIDPGKIESFDTESSRKC